MEISVLKNNISFGAKNPKIRKADDIMRQAKRVYPLVSSTYIDTFYSNGDARKAKLKKSVVRRITDTIRTARDTYLSRNPAFYDFSLKNEQQNVLHNVLLHCIGKTKAGNCSENAALAVAALAANGIYDTKCVSLYMGVEYLNPKDNTVLYKNRFPLDHAFVLTSMGENPSGNIDIHDDKLIVVDPWLGFADSVPAAKVKFDQYLCRKEDIAEYREVEDRLFTLAMYKKGKNIQPEDCKVNYSFIFIDNDSSMKCERENLGMHLRMRNSGLVLPQKQL